jgi:hypothetical protein
MDKKKNKIIISPYTQDAFHGVKLVKSGEKVCDTVRYGVYETQFLITKGLQRDVVHLD